MPTLATRTYYDKDRGEYICASVEFSFIEASGDTPEEAESELQEALREIASGESE